MVTPDHFIVTTFSVRWILLFLSCTDEETRDFSSAMQLVHRTSLRTSRPRQSLSASHQEQPFRNTSPRSLHSSLAYDITSRILTKFMLTLIRFKKSFATFRTQMKTYKHIDISSVPQSCLTLCDPMDCCTAGFPVCHQLPELAHTHIHQVDDVIQPSHSLWSPSPPAVNFSQHQGFF